MSHFVHLGSLMQDRILRLDHSITIIIITVIIMKFSNRKSHEILKNLKFTIIFGKKLKI